jgi:serine/threonine protein kinase
VPVVRRGPRYPGLAPGTVVAGRYEVQGRLGAGGMGVVYKARDRLLDEVVALKVLRPDATGSDEMARRFRSEIRLARAVSHRNVCRIHEHGEEGALRYVSMTFVDGIDLPAAALVRSTDSRLRSRPALTFEALLPPTMRCGLMTW